MYCSPMLKTDLHLYGRRKILNQTLGRRNRKNDVATNGIPFWLTVDLKTVKNSDRHSKQDIGELDMLLRKSRYSHLKMAKMGIHRSMDYKGRTQTITFEEKCQNTLSEVSDDYCSQPRRYHKVLYLCMVISVWNKFSIN